MTDFTDSHIVVVFDGFIYLSYLFRKPSILVIFIVAPCIL